jgi:hypothetical protein
VFRFDPETTERKRVAETVAEWACVVVEDYAAQTMWPLAHE